MAGDRAPWQGSVLFTEHAFAYVGAVRETALHSHHAVQLTIALDGVPLVLQDAKGGSQRSLAFMVRADVPHAVSSSSERVLLVYVEPESDVGVACRELFDGRHAAESHEWSLAGAALPVLSSEAPINIAQLVERALAPFAKPGRSGEYDARVKATLDLLPQLARQGEVRVSRTQRRSASPRAA